MINSYKRLIEEGKFSRFFRRVGSVVSRLRPEPNTPPEDTPARTGTSRAPDREDLRRKAGKELVAAWSRGNRPPAIDPSTRETVRGAAQSTSNSPEKNDTVGSAAIRRFTRRTFLDRFRR